MRRAAPFLGVAPGQSDLGVNAARIRTYLAALHEAEKPDN